MLLLQIGQSVRQRECLTVSTPPLLPIGCAAPDRVTGMSEARHTCRTVQCVAMCTLARAWHTAHIDADIPLAAGIPPHLTLLNPSALSTLESAWLWLHADLCKHMNASNTCMLT